MCPHLHADHHMVRNVEMLIVGMSTKLVDVSLDLYNIKLGFTCTYLSLFF